LKTFALFIVPPLATSQARPFIRGTDFALHYDGELHLAVHEGVIFAKNEGGEEVYDANLYPYGKVISAKAKPRRIKESELPADAPATFRVLQRDPSQTRSGTRIRMIQAVKIVVNF